MNRKFVLASGSPRRKQLLSDVGLQYEIITSKVDEEKITEQLLQSNEVEKKWIPEMLAKAKALNVAEFAGNENIIISADTIVLLDGEIIGKPMNENHAIESLKKISGKKHEVISGVCIYDNQQKKILSIFNEMTEVYFKRLSLEQINFYIKAFKPFDKAGSYAIQEWIGLIGIEKINGCFYNVMGLPVSKLMSELQRLNLY
jgi:septum formation protein